jgi:hypothetical protein
MQTKSDCIHVNPTAENVDVQWNEIKCCNPEEMEPEKMETNANPNFANPTLQLLFENHNMERFQGKLEHKSLHGCYIFIDRLN